MYMEQIALIFHSYIYFVSSSVIPNPTTITPTTDTTTSTTKSEGSVTATSTDTTKSDASDTQGYPSFAPTTSTSTNGGDFTSLFLYMCIILLLILVPSAYVYHLNREKVCSLL